MMKSLWRSAVVALVAAAALGFSNTANADVTKGLSLRLGYGIPMNGNVREYAKGGLPGIGAEYQVSFLPKLLNGEAWSTSISADLHYRQTKNGIVRYIPVSINQVYTFEERNGNTPYAGFSLSAITFGSTDDDGGSPTVTKFAAGLIVGLNLGTKLYIEGRYDWVDQSVTGANIDAVRTYLGYRF